MKRYIFKYSTFAKPLKAEKKDGELQNIVAEQEIRIQRILGKLIKEGQSNGEIRKQNEGTRVSANKELSQLGINKRESRTFKAIASIPEEAFELEISKKKQAVNKAVSELTTTGMLRLAKRNVRVSKNSKAPTELPKGIFNIIYCDPPWQQKPDVE